MAAVGVLWKPRGHKCVRKPSGTVVLRVGLPPHLRTVPPARCGHCRCPWGLAPQRAGTVAWPGMSEGVPCLLPHHLTVWAEPPPWFGAGKGGLGAVPTGGPGW